MRKTVLILVAAILLTHTVLAAEASDIEASDTAHIELPSIKNVFNPAPSGEEAQTERLTGEDSVISDPAPAAASSDAVTMEGDGFSTPEEAVSAYVEAMNAGDINAMVATFAVETYIDHLDAAANIRRLKIFAPNTYSSVPVTGPLSRGILIERRRNEITELIYYSYIFYATLDTDFDRIGTGATQTFQDDASIENFIATMETAPPEDWIGHISVTKVCAPDDPLVSEYMPDISITEKTLENMENQLAICGGDEYAERIAVMDVDGSLGVQFMECIRYGDKWYNWRTQSLLANLLGVNYTLNGLGAGSLMEDMN